MLLLAPAEFVKLLRHHQLAKLRQRGQLARLLVIALPYAFAAFDVAEVHSGERVLTEFRSSATSRSGFSICFSPYQSHSMFHPVLLIVVRVRKSSSDGQAALSEQLEDSRLK